VTFAYDRSGFDRMRMSGWESMFLAASPSPLVVVLAILCPFVVRAQGSIHVTRADATTRCQAAWGTGSGETVAGATYNGSACSHIPQTDIARWKECRDRCASLHDDCMKEVDRVFGPAPKKSEP